MKKRILCFVLFMFSLAGCSSDKDANEKNFSTAITKYLEINPQKDQVDEKNRICFNMGSSIDINQSDIPRDKALPESLFNKMAALEKAGLFTGADIEEKYSVITTKVRKYKITDEGKKYYSNHTSNICFGKPVLDKVIKWEEVLKLGDSQRTRVTYRYKIDNIPAWANDPVVQSAFPFFKNTVKENTVPIVLTNNVWEVD